MNDSMSDSVTHDTTVVDTDDVGDGGDDSDDNDDSDGVLDGEGIGELIGEEKVGDGRNVDINVVDE